MQNALPRIVLTPGEPAGIGPDISIQLAQHSWQAEIIVIADPDLLLQRAAQLQLPLRLEEFNFANRIKTHTPQQLKIIPCKLADVVTPGKLNIANAHYVMNTLHMAADLALAKKAAAIVTGPVNKGMLNQAGINFSGHTEFFAHCAGVDKTVMLFVIDQLKVALATTHLPLSAVSANITRASLEETLKILHAGLKQYFKIIDPKILVCGVNPHAGEGGYLGREEIEIINPLLAELRTQGYLFEGALPADTIFTPPYLQNTDAILAMYHDQALPLVKYVGFGHAVNMTLGLPFIRTSVDHGTALDKAGKEADPGSLFAAMQLAIKLATQ